MGVLVRYLKRWLSLAPVTVHDLNRAKRHILLFWDWYAFTRGQHSRLQQLNIRTPNLSLKHWTLNRFTVTMAGR